MDMCAVEAQCSDDIHATAGIIPHQVYDAEIYNTKIKTFSARLKVDSLEGVLPITICGDVPIGITFGYLGSIWVIHCILSHQKPHRERRTIILRWKSQHFRRALGSLSSPLLNVILQMSENTIKEKVDVGLVSVDLKEAYECSFSRSRKTTGHHRRPEWTFTINHLMSKSYKKDSASSRKRKLSDGNDAVEQSRATTPTGFKRWKRGGHGVPDRGAGPKDVRNASYMAIESHSGTDRVGEEPSLALINDPLRVTANQTKNILQATCAVAIDALRIVKDVADAVPVAGNPLKATCGVIIDVLELIRESDAAHEGWKELVQTIADASDMAGRVLKWSQDHPEWHQNVRDQIIKYMRKLDEIRYELSDHIHEPVDRPRALKSLWHNLKHAPKEAAVRKISEGRIKGFRDDLNVIRLDLANVLSLQTAATTSEIVDNIQQLRSELKEQEIDSLLRGVTSAAMANGDIHRTCTKGTRGFILDDIRSWVDDDAAPQIFLLIDAAGYGKSTIAKQMATELVSERRLLGRFFFSRSAEETRTTKCFFSTIAQQGICRFDSSLRLIVAAGIKKLIDPVSTPLEEQFQELFVSPLENMKREGVLILDALDECEASLWDSARSPLTLILSSLPNIPNLKVFITSRPEAEIVSSLMNGRHARQVISSSSNRQNNTDDIETFFIDELKKLEDQLSKDDIMALVKQADGLFIWATTAAKMLLRRGLSQQRKLDILLDPQYKELDVLYRDVLETAISEYEMDDAMRVLEIVAIATEPLSPSNIDQLLEQPGSFSLIQRMASVLLCETSDDPVRFLHPTFLEFLLQRNRSGQYAIDSCSAHHSIALCTLRILQKELKYDICQIIRPGKPLPMNADIPNLDELARTHISAPLRYSSLHWITHALNVLENNDVCEKMLGFFREKLLNWIEMIGLMRFLVPCIANIGQLLDAIRKPAGNTSTEDIEWIEDILDFFRSNQTLLTVSTLHVYTSALMWRPLSSPIRTQYLTTSYPSNVPQIKICIERDLDTSNRLLGHIGRVDDIIPHPNDRYIISLSSGENRDLQLIQWDIKTRTKVWEKTWGIQHRGDYYKQVVYSPDKTHIVLGCNKGLMVYLKLEDAGLKEIWSNYSLHPTLVAVLPTGNQAIYIYNVESKVSTPQASFFLEHQRSGCFIGILDLITQETIVNIFHRKSEHIEYMCVSESGLLFATASLIPLFRANPRSIILWNMRKDAAPSRRHYWMAKSAGITFLPQSTKLLSIGEWIENTEWCIWDAETGEQVFCGHLACGRPIHTLESDQLAIIGSDFISSINLHTLEETKKPKSKVIIDLVHSGFSTCWVESQNTIFWGYRNQIKMANIEDQNKLKEGSDVDLDRISSLSFLDGGRMLVASYVTKWVKVWSTDSGEMYKSMQVDELALSVVCSLGSSFVIISSHDDKTKMWDISQSDHTSRNFCACTEDSMVSIDTNNGRYRGHACRKAVIHPTLDIFATVCVEDHIARIHVEGLKPDSTLAPRRISLAYEVPSWAILRLAFHPDGRYLCFNQQAWDMEQQAWDISVDPPVSVSGLALGDVLDKTFGPQSPQSVFRYRDGDHGLCWIDVGIPTCHSFAFPLGFAITDIVDNDPTRILAMREDDFIIATKDNFLALGGDRGRIILIDFSNLVNEVGTVGFANVSYESDT